MNQKKWERKEMGKENKVGKKIKREGKEWVDETKWEKKRKGERKEMGEGRILF